MRKLLLGAATVITSLGLTAGVAAAQTGGGSIEDTGPDSFAAIKTKIKSRSYVKNKNNLYVTNGTSQTAWSGEAEVEDNNDGGDATSGDAANSNTFNLTATVNNNSAATVAAGLANLSDPVGGGDISDTGPDSFSKISTKVYSSSKVKNYNNINVQNFTEQYAYSGDAEVEENTDGGDAQSGNATNTNTTSITLSVSN